MSISLPNKLNKKTLEMFEMLDRGLTIDEAWTLSKPGKELTPANKSLIKQKFELYSLQHPKRIKKAALAVDKTLSGKSIGDAKPPNTSDILTAAKMVLDRAEPIINTSQNININTSVSPVDLSKYLNNN